MESFSDFFDKALDFFNKALMARDMVLGDGISRQVQHEYRLAEMTQESQYQMVQLELRNHQNRELQLIMHELRIEFERARRRMENSPFFHDDLDTAELLWQEFKAQGKPLFLISPFWDETKPNLIVDGGGGDSHFRTAISGAWQELQYSSYGVCLDGVFKRPLRQTDIDIRWIRNVLKDLPIILVYGYTDGKSVNPRIVTWNVLPNASPNQITSFYGKALLPGDRDDEDFRRLIGQAVTVTAGAVMGITEEGKSLYGEMRVRLTHTRSLPPVQNIHGWSATQVKALQQQTAQALGLPVEFRDELEVGDQGPVMVVIPAGRFLMGSPKGEPERQENERQHEVEVARFALGKYTVTVGQFKQFVEAKGYRTKAEEGGGCYYWTGSEYKQDPYKGWHNLGFSQTDNHPVVGVSWNDAIAYTAWLSDQTGQQYRLPTEAEWEYAARAGTTTPFYFGETISTDQANYDGNSAYSNGRKGVYRKKTVEVGQFPANAWGLHEMHGNVWEWACSLYDGTYDGGEQRCAEPGMTGLRVLRGGSWLSVPGRLRGAARDWSTPLHRGYVSGFRLARIFP